MPIKKWFFYSFLFLSTGVFAHIPVPGTVAGFISFTENKGQWKDTILYSSDINGGYVNLLNQGFDYTFIDFQKINNIHHGKDTNKTFDMFWLKVRFLNSNPAPVITKSGPSTDFTNYFLGDDPSKWASKAYNYKKISYQSIYNGVDLQVYSRNNNLKYDLTIAAKADISKIRLQYDGAKEIKLENGELRIKTGLTDIYELKPVAWQYINNQKVNIECNYTLHKNVLGFKMGSSYNAAYPLVIDPEIVFSSYTGSQSDNWGYTATFDDQENTYAGGIVFNPRDYNGAIVDSNKFTVSPGAYQQKFSGGRTDITIFKFSPDGKERVYGTYLGGPKLDIPQSMIVDKLGNLIILGNTGGNFPIADPSSAFDPSFNGGLPLSALTGEMYYANGSDIFLAKLSADGSQLLSSTYIGGSKNDGINIFKGNDAEFYNYGDDFRGEVIVDNKNNILVASTTLSNNFPFKNSFDNTLSGTQDAVVFKLTNNMDTLLFSGYFGGSEEDAAFSIQLDSKQNIFFTGSTLSTNLPTSGTGINKAALGGLDGFVCKLDSNGKKLLAATYLGTSEDDQAFFVQLDKFDKVYVLGQTWGQYPVTAGVYKNPNSGQFIHKLNNNLSSTEYSTVFGSGSGSPDISPTAFLVNYCGVVLVSGWMGDLHQVSVNPVPERNMPLTADAYQHNNPNSRGFYFCSFGKNMTYLDYATHFGGLNNFVEYNGYVYTLPGFEHVDGGTSRFDKNGKIYQAICAGCGRDVFDKRLGYAQTPTTPFVWSNFNESDNCNELAVKFDFGYVPVSTKITTSPPAINDTIRGTLPVVKVDFTNLSKKIGPGTSFEWYYNNTLVGSATTQALSYQFNEMGIVQFKLKGVDTSSCSSGDSTVIVVISDPTVTGHTICAGDSGQFHVIGGSIFNWSPALGLNNIHSPNPKLFIMQNTDYTVEVSNGSYTKTLSIAGVLFPYTVYNYHVETFKDWNSETADFTGLTRVKTNNWNVGDGKTYTDSTFSVLYNKMGAYPVIITGIDTNNCNYRTESVLEIDFMTIPNVFTPNGDQHNESFEIKGLKPGTVTLEVFNRWGSKVFESGENNYDNSWRADKLPDGLYFYKFRLNYRPAKPYNGWVQVIR